MYVTGWRTYWHGCGAGAGACVTIAHKLGELPSQPGPPILPLAGSVSSAHTRGVETRALRWLDPPEGPAIALVDQTRLPAVEAVVTCADVPALVDAIRRLVVRGAPMLGVAGAFGVALAAYRGDAVAGSAAVIERARPTAVNLGWGARRALAAYQQALRDPARGSERAAARAAVAEARSIAAEDAAASAAMARHGLSLIPEGARILTHCNTGALVSAGEGTAFAVILAAHRAGGLCGVQPGLRRYAAAADHCHRDRTRHRTTGHNGYAACPGCGTGSSDGSPYRRLRGTMGFMKGRVLVVDDDAALAEMLGIVLRGEGFEPTFVADGDKAMAAFRDTPPDLVLLDLMLPGMDGIDVCRQIRAESGVPIVMLTAKSDTVDVVLGLESGADDYIVKPFQSKVLIARVRARLRRTDDPVPEMLAIGDVSIDVAGHSVKRAGEPLNLTPLEFDLLVALARKPRQVFTREVLLEQVWGYRHAADTRLVNVHVQRLRAKIEKDPERPEIVVTVRGVGYKAGPG